MFYSHSIEDNKFNIFALFLNQIIHGEDKYKQEIDHVLKEVQALACGEKNLYEIDKDKLPIILYLKNAEPDFFAEINLKSISKSVYRKMLTSIEEKRSSFINESSST